MQVLYPSGADGVEWRLTSSVSITSHSTSVLRKQATASRGVHTIGSLTLNDVFNNTGTPVRRAKDSRSLRYRGFDSASTVCTLAVPSTWTTAGMTPFIDDCTAAVRTMNGEDPESAKYSLARSSNTDGAKGRKGSRNFTFMLIKARMSSRRGSASRLRLPNARGPHSIRP